MKKPTKRKLIRYFKSFAIVKTLVLIAILSANSQENLSKNTNGLLFYLSAEKGFSADFAVGSPEPEFKDNVKNLDAGAIGKGIECETYQILTYQAPGNIYAQRGTLGFFWKSGEVLGETEFPIFRVSYADHSSWDMVWLRIDYNGHGFDAFVTDVNLNRIRVSYEMPEIPKPEEWMHIAFSWDENTGVKLYLNGSEVAQDPTSANLDAGLDQFGPHSRIISPYQVQSRYCFVRGGDIDEITIYDHALKAENIKGLAQGISSFSDPAQERLLKNQQWFSEWEKRFGWNNPDNQPPYLSDNYTSVKKVEILDVYDQKRWWWKANDGILETTWPGVYNRSSLKGRTDYFILPDWDCYSTSGWAIDFMMPNEPWNYVEISGAAHGNSFVKENRTATQKIKLFDRPANQQRTFNKIDQSYQGKIISFQNKVQELPISEFNAFYISEGNKANAKATLQYNLQSNDHQLQNPCLSDLNKHIDTRFMGDEISKLVAIPGSRYRAKQSSATENKLPIVQILIPNDFRNFDNQVNNRPFNYTWENIYAGLDGIEIQIPALSCEASMDGKIPVNLQIKDPLSPLRNMFDFSFSVKPNETRTIWCDLRDRILPNGKPIYLTLAFGSKNFSTSELEGASIKLIFKDYNEAKIQHVADRFTQVKDNFGMCIEEYPSNRRLSKYDRLRNDLSDLLRIEPDHKLARNYQFTLNQEQGEPDVELPNPPANIPAWAFYQVEALKRLEYMVEWYIDNRQIENGEFGGGLSDDGDLTHYWPAVGLMGFKPEKVSNSLLREFDAFYENGMFTDGLPTIQTDGLHVYEEGIQVESQAFLLDFGNPKTIERMMETTRNLADRIIQVNKAGHYHFRSNYYSATKIAKEGVWEWTTHPQFMMLQPAIYLAKYYNNKAAKELIINVANGILAHNTVDKSGKIIINPEVNFSTDELRNEEGIGRYFNPNQRSLRNLTFYVSSIYILWSAWEHTDDMKYLQPILDQGPATAIYITSNMIDLLDKQDDWGKLFYESTTPDSRSEMRRHLAWKYSKDKSYLENYYQDMIRSDEIYEYMNTEGSMWIDRIYACERELQYSRMGGVADSRNAICPGHVISWDFKAPAKSTSLGILVHYSSPEEIKLEVFNLEDFPVDTEITGWDVANGEWELVQGTDSNNDAEIDGKSQKSKYSFGLNQNIPLHFEAKQTSMVHLKLKKKGEDTGKMADLGICKSDVQVNENLVLVKLHNLGAVDAQSTTVALIDEKGNVVSSVLSPIIKAPHDLIPKTAEIEIKIPEQMSTQNLSVQIDPEQKIKEVSRNNNKVKL